MRRLQLSIHKLPDNFVIEQAFLAIANRPSTIFLDSAMRGASGRYSLLVTDPLSEWIAPFKWEKLREVWQATPVESDCNWPFRGGWIGYIGYETYAHLTNKVPPRASHYPPFHFALYDTFLLADRQTHQSYLASLGLAGPKGDSDQGRAEQKMADLYEQIRRHPSNAHNGSLNPVSKPIRPLVDRQQYRQHIRIIQDFIAAGDCYQVNYTQCFSGTTTDSPVTLYQRLRAINPAPYAAFLNYGSFQILSSSPESFLEISGDLIRTRPIKGTRPRGADTQSDQRYRNELHASEKDRAELLMITDLERNDLGRVCRAGSVATRELAGLLTLPHLYHLYSLVEGRLLHGMGAWDVLAACFPGGSITGAPKIRAMQIIHELESHPREVYTGAIGFISLHGDMQMNVAIRTMIYDSGEVKIYTGGGIVADSDPDAEYEECLVKMRGMQEALR